MNHENCRVLLSGLPGRMCGEVARRLLESPDEFPLLDFALVGPEITAPEVEAGGRRFKAITPSRREELVAALDTLRPMIAVDFTVPSAIEGNVDFFCQHQIPFVLGTTGGDTFKIHERVSRSRVSAVVAPNMAIPIVLIQSAARWAATNFPGALTGYRVEVRESHQAAKKDTSGTAKALVADLQALGLPAEVDRIEKIRDPGRQRELGVPDAYLDGHAYHTYTVTSPDGSVTLSLTHNILGRRVYAEGTVWAIRFLAHRLGLGDHGCSYDMQDVLREMADLI